MASSVLGKRSAKETELHDVMMFLESADEGTLGSFDSWYRWNKKLLIDKHVPDGEKALREGLITYRAEREFKHDLDDKGCPPLHVYHSDFCEILYFNLVAGFLSDLVDDLKYHTEEDCEGEGGVRGAAAG